MTELTPERLFQMEARAEAASAGPWRSTGHSLKPGQDVHQGEFTGNVFICHCRSWNGREEARRTAEFVAHVRTDAPDAYAEIRRAWGRIEELEDTVARATV